MIDLVNVPKTVRINEAWEVGYNQIVDFSPYLEGTGDSVSVLDFPVQNVWCTDKLQVLLI